MVMQRTANPSTAVRFRPGPPIKDFNIMSKFPCIVGASDFPLQDRGKAKEGNTELTIQRYCAQKALEQAGLNFSDVNGIAVAGMWGVPGPGIMQPNVLTEYLGIKNPRWVE